MHVGKNTNTSQCTCPQSRSQIFHTRHQQQAKRQWSLSQNTDTSRVGQKLPIHSLDTGLHRRISWKCYKKWRMWHLHPITIAIPGGDMCSKYRAEAQALLTVTETVIQLETRPKKVLTDSLSVLQSLASGNLQEDYTLRILIQSLNGLTSRTTAVLQWIPAHTGIHGKKCPISWRKRESRSSSKNPNLVTKKQKRSSETRD